MSPWGTAWRVSATVVLVITAWTETWTKGITFLVFCLGCMIHEEVMQLRRDLNESERDEKP